jgi:regulator of protease activity HflC (stomatin/prohibitin superfamily)
MLSNLKNLSRFGYLVSPINRSVNGSINGLINRSINKPQNTRNLITVVNQAEIAYREFLGSNRVRLEPGLHIKLPLLHHLSRVDMREQGINIENLHGYTKDNVPVIISGTLFMRVTDAEKACFEVRNYIAAVSAVGESSVRSVIGKFEYDTITSERNKINVELKNVIGLSIAEWGTECTRFEIQNMSPANRGVTEQLEAQMRAERSRRENELNTIAKIKTAEGEKQSHIFQSEGAAISIENKAKADKYAVEQATKAVVDQLSQIKQALPNVPDDKVLDFLLESKRLENLNALSRSDNKQIYFVNSQGMLPTQYGKIVSDLLNKEA